MKKTYANQTSHYLIRSFVISVIVVFAATVLLTFYYQISAANSYIEKKSEQLSEQLCNQITSTLTVVSNYTDYVCNENNFLSELTANDYKSANSLKTFYSNIEYISKYLSSLWIICDDNVYQCGNAFNIDIKSAKNKLDSISMYPYLTQSFGVFPFEIERAGVLQKNILFARNIPYDKDKTCTFIYGISLDILQDYLNGTTFSTQEAVEVTAPDGSVISQINSPIVEQHSKFFSCVNSSIANKSYRLNLHINYYTTFKWFFETYCISLIPPLGIYFVLILAAILLYSRYIVFFTSPLNNFIIKLKTLAHDKYNYNNIISPKDFNYLEHIYDNLFNEINSLLDTINKVKEENNQLEKKSLTQQINPHFINNTLEQIRMSCELNNDTMSANMIVQLGSMLKYTFRCTETFVPIDDEINHVSHYVTLMKSVTSYDFDFICNVSPDVGYNRIPHLCLQPLVENCFTHGKIGKSGHGGIIEISAEKLDSSHIKLTVSDNGTGFDSIPPKSVDKGGNHVSIKNISRRLQLQFGENQSISFENKNGATLTIIIPAI